jgi:hypothetical protein
MYLLDPIDRAFFSSLHGSGRAQANALRHLLRTAMEVGNLTLQVAAILRMSKHLRNRIAR